MGLSGYNKAIKRKGFFPAHIFVPVPRLTNIEEFVFYKSNLLPLPFFRKALLSIALFFSLQYFLVDGFVFLCKNKPVEKGNLLLSIKNSIEATNSNNKLSSYSLERFSLRLRGAMVITIKDVSNSRYFIIRVASDKRTKKIVYRNQEFLRQMYGVKNKSDYLRSILPEPIDRFEIQNSAVYIETMLFGDLAWKYIQGSLRDRIYQSSIDFLLIINRKTRQKVILEKQELDQLLFNDLNCLKSLNRIDLGLLEEVERIVSITSNILLHREVYLSLMHGDFGYGNILINPRNGQITGVIDWDTGRLKDLVGIDFINFEIQKKIIEDGNDFFTAILNLNRIVNDESTPNYINKKLIEFGVNYSIIKAVFAITLFRYFIRSSQYAELFFKEQNKWLNIFQNFREISFE
jgi:hypothetical protein